MVTSEFRDFCENRKSPYRSKVSMRIQRSRPFFMSTWISQSDFEVLAQILESFVRYSVLMKLDVISCSDELRRWFWVEIALEFYSGFKYTHENSRMQLTGCQNRKNMSMLNRDIEIVHFGADFDSESRFGWHHSIRLEILHKKHFSWFFRKFWSDMSCRELPRIAGSHANFVDTTGFSIKFCATYVLGRSVEQIWAPLYGFRGLFFYNKKNKICYHPNLSL